MEEYNETPECEIKPEEYSPDAVHRALNRSVFTRDIARELFRDWLRDDVVTEVTTEKADKALAKCFELADLFRRHTDHYHKAQLDFCQNALEEKVKGTKLILPRSGILKDHYPNGSIPGVL